MDYHVYCQLRQGAVDGGMSTERQSPRESSDRIDRDAAIVMVRSSRCSTLRTLELKQAGFGPLRRSYRRHRDPRRAAGRHKLGDWNWYLPNWLNWLRLEHGSQSNPPRPPRHLPSRGSQQTDA
jgi:hypothetical protein